MTTDVTNYTGADGNKPWLCIQNEVTAATLTASSSATDHDVEALRGPQTYSTWSPVTFPAWALASFSVSEGINYVSLRVEEGGGCTFTPQKFVGGSWVDLGAGLTVGGGDAETLLWIFDTQTTDDVRVYVTGSSDDCHVANMKAGRATIIPYCPPPGYAPSLLNPVESFVSVFSEGGSILGSMMERSQASEALTFENLTPAWVRSEWPTIRALFRTESVVFAWRPVTYPNELIYGMVTGQPSVTYATHSRMTATFTIEGPAP